MTRSVFNPRAGAQITVTFDERQITPSLLQALRTPDGSPTGISRDARTFTVHATPRDAVVLRNGYHEADTWHLGFDMRILPFDPEGISAIAVRIYMWDSEGDDLGREWAIDANEMVRGLADEDSIEITPQQTLVMSGRDYTGVLDPEWDIRNPIPFGKNLRDTVQSIADSAAPAGTTARFQVVWNVNDDSGNPVDPTKFLTFQSARSTKKKGAWVRAGKTTWEVIYELVIHHGLICFVQGASIFISNPRTQTQQSLLQAPRVTHGRDLMTFKATRRLAKNRVPQIRIVYWDALARQRFEIVYPAAHQAQPLAIGLGLKKNEIETLPAPRYCHDRDSALRYAKMRWEMLARSETSYTFTTRHMKVPGGGDIDRKDRMHTDDINDTSAGNEYNLLALQAGQAVGVAFDPFNQEQMRALDVGQRVEFLNSLGYAPQVSNFVAHNIETIDQFRQPYYCRKAEYRFDQKDGLTIEVEAVNFASEKRELAFASQPTPPGLGVV